MIGRPVRLRWGDEGGEHQQMKSKDQAGEDLGGHGKDFDSYPECDGSHWRHLSKEVTEFHIFQRITILKDSLF